MARDSMVFYRSVADAVAELDAEEYKTMMQAIFAYAFDGTEPHFDSRECRMSWKLITQQVNACIRKYEAQVSNGQKGGRPRKTKTQENPTKPKETQKNPTKTLNEKCEMRNAFNDECITAWGRAQRESDDENPDEDWDLRHQEDCISDDDVITTTDGRTIKLKDLKFPENIKVGVTRR